jgi:surfactin synthase thioesterase subunit
MTDAVFCLPAAGAGATVYRRWQRAAREADLEVYALAAPGRDGDRGRPATSVAQIVDALAEEVRGHPVASCAVLGHSFGAILGFELIRRMAADPGLPFPELLVAVGSAAPSRSGGGRKHELGDEEFVAAVEALGGMPPGVLDDPDLRELLLPVLRADFTAAETYRPQPGATVPVPVTAVVGDADRTVSREGLDAWSAHTTAGCRHHVVRGGHFLLDDARDELLGVVRADLARARGTAR